eukprot:COSAG05_NODE_7576_length_795_cov_1.021552_2_plen_114_part_00
MPALAPAAIEPAATPERSFTPSMWNSTARSAQLQATEALPLMVERLLEEARVEKAEMRAEIGRLRAELTPKPQQDGGAVSDEQLAALQARLQAIHQVKLLNVSCIWPGPPCES